jgi:hypothetical protein
MALADTVGAAGTAAMGLRTATLESKTNFFAAALQGRSAPSRARSTRAGAPTCGRRGSPTKRPAPLAHHPDPDDPVNGVLAAVVSSALGGSAAALTRYAIGASDPVTLAAFRFGIGFLLILPLALASGARFPHGADRLAVGALGVLFFAVFFFMYNIAMSLTSAARGSLALSVLPLTTMLAAALLGREELTRRKTCGVLIAIAGVAVGALGRPRRRAGGRLARRPDHGARHDLHGALQRLVAAAHGALEHARLPRRRDGLRRCGERFARLGLGRPCGDARVRSRAVDRRALPRRVRRRGGVLPLGVRARAHHADARRQHDDGEPDRRFAARRVLIGEPLGAHLAFGVAAVGGGIWLAFLDARGALD